MSIKENIEFSNNSHSVDGGSNMFFGANPKLFDLAQELRARMTPAEEIFWDIIKINVWHLKFRRQHPISNYIVDFYCHKLKLVIELDSGYHDNMEVKIYDEVREKDFKNFGITLLRFKNEEVIGNIENVLTSIENTISLIKENNKEKTKTLNNSPLGDGGRDPLFVIKIGGNIIDDEKNLSSFLSNFSKIGGPKILIHGGGKIATNIGNKLGITSKYINGRRITDAETIDLVTMVYAGLINKKIVAKLQGLNCNAIGLTGADANIIPAKKRPVVFTNKKNDGENLKMLNNSTSKGGGIDFGFVGDISSDQLLTVNYQLFLSNGLTPIIAPLTHDGKGQILNTNADTIASSIAIALSKIYDVRLIYCFEKKGVLKNVDDENSAIPLITKDIYQQLKKGNKLFDGILPKIDNAFAAIDSGVKEVLIGQADDLLQNISGQTTGTLIK